MSGLLLLLLKDENLRKVGVSADIRIGHLANSR
jgi:hypothetical protein